MTYLCLNASGLTAAGVCACPQNNIVRRSDGRLVYANPRGELELLSQEHVRRGPNWQLGEPEGEMRVRAPFDILGVRPAQHSTAQHSTAQHSTAQHSTAQHSTAQPKHHICN